MPVFSRLIATALVFVILVASAGAVFAGLGQPTRWQINFQESASPVMDQITTFNTFLFWITTAIALFVLILLAIVIVRFNARANPTPSRTTHNTPIESDFATWLGEAKKKYSAEDSVPANVLAAAGGLSSR